MLGFATDVGASVGAPALAMICIITGILLYFPLFWAASSWGKNLLRRRRAPRPT